RNTIGALKYFSIVTTAPIDPPSRTNAGSLPKAERIASRAASAWAPVCGPRYGLKNDSGINWTSGFLSFMKFRTNFKTFWGFWFGTNRMLTFASAQYGIAVFTPGPV